MNELPISKTRLYKIFQGMKDRCYNPKSSHYKTYGGRGITICPEWLDKGGVQSFISWSLNNGYDDNLSLDRIDNNKSYSPDNCQWVTKSYNSSKGNLGVEYIKKFDNQQSQGKTANSSNKKTPLKLSLKALITEQGFTMSQVNDELNRRHGTSLSFQNFSNRFRKESFSYNEVVEILDVVGYRVEWIEK